MRIPCLAILVTTASAAVVLPASSSNSYPTKPFSVPSDAPEDSRRNELVQMLHLRRAVVNGDDEPAGESGGHRQILLGSETDQLLDAMIGAPTKSKTHFDVAQDGLEALKNKHTTVLKNTLKRNPKLTVEEKEGLLRDTDSVFRLFMTAASTKEISSKQLGELLGKIDRKITPSLEKIVFRNGYM